MKIYQLFTESRREWWVKASSSVRAIQLAEYLANSRVVCWFADNTPPSTFKVYRA